MYCVFRLCQRNYYHPHYYYYNITIAFQSDPKRLKINYLMRSQSFFFEKKIYFHKTNLQKNHTYNTKHTIYKKKKSQKKIRSIKRRRRNKLG